MFLDYLVLGADTEEFLNTGDIVATVLIFLILMILLKKFAWGPLMGIMQEREELVAKDIDAAEKARKETQAILEEQKALLKEARTEAQSIIEGAKKQGDITREEIVSAGFGSYMAAPPIKHATPVNAKDAPVKSRVFPASTICTPLPISYGRLS